MLTTLIEFTIEFYTEYWGFIFTEAYIIYTAKFNSILFLKRQNNKIVSGALQSPGPEPPWIKHNSDRGKEKLLYQDKHACTRVVNVHDTYSVLC